MDKLNNFVLATPPVSSTFSKSTSESLIQQTPSEQSSETLLPRVPGVAQRAVSALCRATGHEFVPALVFCDEILMYSSGTTALSYSTHVENKILHAKKPKRGLVPYNPQRLKAYIPTRDEFVKFKLEDEDYCSTDNSDWYVRTPEEETIYQRRLNDLPHLQVQNEEREQASRIFWNCINRGAQQGFFGDTTENVGWFVGQLDIIFSIHHWWKKCDCYRDYYVLTQTAHRLFTHRALLPVGGHFMFKPSQVQADNVGELLRVLRTSFDTVSAVEDAPIVKKVVQLYSYLLVQGFLTKFGIEMNDDDYSKLERQAMAAKFSSKRSMIKLILDTTLYICERAYAFVKTGDVSEFLHSGSAYSGWLKETDRLLALAPFTSNLEPHGTTYFSFVADVNSAVEKGEAYCKYSKTVAGAESALLNKKLAALLLLKNTEITRRASQKERPAPFGVLVYGSSSVAKSTFSKMLFHYYGALHGLDRDDHFRYVRNPADEYWSNFDSSKWCIQLDDIAFLLPSATAQTDPTLMELLNVVNNVPYVPPQADLADKGKTPVMARLVIATSNAIDLNAHEYFWCPLAVQRRLPFVVDVKPKAEYRHTNGCFIDPTKLQNTTGEFPDYWEIQVRKVVPLKDGARDRATLVKVKDFTDIKEFLKYFGEESRNHEINQAKALSCDKHMSNINVCPLCLYTTTDCSCALEVQFGAQNALNWCVNRISYYAYATILWTMRIKWWLRFQCWLAQYSIFRSLFVMFFLRFQPDVWQMAYLGEMVRDVQTPRNLAAILGVMALIGTCTTLYMQHKAAEEDELSADLSNATTPLPMTPAEVQDFRELHRRRDVEEANKYADKTVEQMDVTDNGQNVIITKYYKRVSEMAEPVLQGNVYGTTEDQILKESKSNVWYNPTVELARFELPLSSQSLVGRDNAFLRDLFSANVVRIEIASRTEVRYTGGTGAVFVKGQYLLVNNHSFKDTVSDFDVTIISQRVNEGISRNLKVRVPASCIMRDRDNDICLIEILSLPPQKDILKFWAERQFTATRLLSVRRQKSGLTEMQEILAVDSHPCFPIEELKTSVGMYMGRGERLTHAGDCGAIGIANTPMGAAIVGLHVLGANETTGIMFVPKSAIEALIEKTRAKFGTLCVQGGGGPVLDLKDKCNPLGPLHYKSVFRYLDRGSVNVFGTFLGFKPKPRSRVMPTPFSEEFLAHYNTVNKYGPPAMAGWEPWRINLVKMVQPTCNLDPEILDECVKHFVKDIVSGLPEGWEKDMMFLSDRAAVNGLPGVCYIDLLNTSTSMGYPWNKSKREFIFPAKDETYPEGIDFPPEVWERVADIKDKYKRGLRAYPVFVYHPKDEATPLSKVEIKKTRLFAGGPVDWSIVVRSRLLTFVRLLQKNKFIFEAGPGTVCQSTEWGEIYDYLTAFGLDRMVAGDYGSYDKKMIADMILAAFRVIVGVCRAAGYSEEELLEIMCIGYDIAFSVCNFNGDLVMFLGTNPSGHPLTVIVNSLVNSLYMRYAYHEINPLKEVASFKRNVHLMTYGDDNAFGVNRNIDWFNHTAIQAEMANIGVTYTMAEKSAKSVPFIHINDTSFLKRKWIYDADVGAWMAPLEEESIIKSLTMWLPSKSVDKYKQMVDVISSANSEYFFYGKEKFEKEHAFLSKMLSQEPYCYYVRESTLPTWDDLYSRFWAASEASIVGVVLADPTNEIKKSEKDLNKSQNAKDSEHVEGVTRSTPNRLVENCDPRARFNNHTNFAIQSEGFETAEAVITSSQIGDAVTTSETVTFIDNEGGVCLNTPLTTNSVAMVDSTQDLSLGTFLARPTLIDTTSWTTSDVSSIKNTIKPWQLFLNNTLIKKKIDNYAFMRGNLHIKVLLNGTPFQYGAMRLAYSPLEGLAPNKVVLPTPFQPALNPYSQQPGLFVYPQANSGGEMVLPFFLHKNWLDITSNTEVANMGTLRYVIYAPLRTAVTGGTTTVTLRTYAWMTDVELMGSTTKLTLQSDEYGQGIVSKPATAVAAVANMLTSVPVIGRFARATEIGAGAVSSIASLFGYTNVPTIENISAFQPMNGPMLASAQIGTAVQKLTLDPKQELSIDPSPHGIGNVDELSLSYLKTKESFFGLTSWSTSDVAGTQIFNMRVNPNLPSAIDINNSVASKVGSQVYHIPLSYIGAMFKHWRGDLIVRMKIVCTKFHKGRLKLSYDPRADISIVDAPENAVYTQIIDVGEEDDVEFRIPYHQDVAWLKTDPLVQDNWTVGNTLAPRQDIDNGLLTLRVLTALTAPVSGSLNILFFVRGAENFEYVNPKQNIGPDSVGAGAYPSFFTLQSEDTTDVVASQYTIGTPSKPVPERYAQNFGECVGSLRNLIHRSVLQDVTSLPDSTSLYVKYRKFYRRMPYSPGFDPTAYTRASNIVAATGTSPYYFTNMPHLPWVSGMYVGYRGGVNYTVTPSCDAYGAIADMRATRATINMGGNPAFRYGDVITSLAHGATTAAKANFLSREVCNFDGTAGAAINATMTNGTLSFNFPDYNHYNFGFWSPATNGAGNTTDGTAEQGVNLEFVLKNPSASVKNYTETISLSSYVSAGPDFTCLYFLCCPTVYYQTVSATPL